MTPRAVKQIVKGSKMMEGAGVRICRTIGTSSLRNLDPFLMLDELKLPAHQASVGFPDHPHKGMNTCSIMLSGQMEHSDSIGNKGVIGPGGVQWMAAGRGIVHSEMPVVTDGMLHGFQLWINLSAKDKLTKPWYQDYQAEDIPTVETSPGSSVRVMAGTLQGVTGPIKMRLPGLLLDVRLEPGASFEHDVSSEWNSFAYVYEGKGVIGGAIANVEHALVFDNDGEGILTNASSDAPLKFLLVAGKPIGEPIVQYGPFVMNTDAEIQQAFADYRAGKLQNPDDNPWIENDEL